MVLRGRIEAPRGGFFAAPTRIGTMLMEQLGFKAPQELGYLFFFHLLPMQQVPASWKTPESAPSATWC